MSYKVKVLADSVSPDGVRLSTIAYQAPRVLLAEMNTHRVLSRSAESSRAIPFSKKLGAVLTHPYFPSDLPDGPLLGESKGMTASGPLNDAAKADGQHLFRALGAVVAKGAAAIADLGFHKQDVNRLLEPWAWTRGVVSSTELANFFALRCDYRACPPFRYLARCVWVALARSVPTPTPWGEWHLPFITAADREEAWVRAKSYLNAHGEPPHGFGDWMQCALARWSAARCARVSYYHFGRTKSDYAADDGTFQKLAGSFPLHVSPCEHQALCAKAGGVQRGFPLSNFRAPWVQHRKFIQGENIRDYTPAADEVASWNVPDAVFAGDPGADW